MRTAHESWFNPALVPNRSTEGIFDVGSLSLNPISALTRADLFQICEYEPTRRLAAEMMEEAQQVAGKLGIRFRRSIEKRITGAERVGKHKTSMLQDLEAGRTLEVEALLGAVIELGRLTATPTPRLDAVYACTRLLDQILQQERATKG